MNLILDLDGTLIDCDDDGDAVPRPHLREFLAGVFSLFSTVSIWTNATPYWFNTVYQNVLIDFVPNGKQFLFVWTREKCVLQQEAFHRPITRKPLSLVYESFATTHSPDNTIVVDDTPETYGLNPEAAIPISRFHWNSNKNEEEDKELLNLLDTLKCIVATRKSKSKSKSKVRF